MPKKPDPNDVWLQSSAVHLQHEPRSTAFKKLGLRIMLGAIACALSLVTTMAQSNLVAHWSFDVDTLTIDSGNITNVADATGNHSAWVTPNGVGPNNRVSAPFSTTNSVAGKFGEGLRFNGDNFLVFPNLTELMLANGAPSYSISMWVRWLNTTAPAGNTAYRTLSDWGNQTPGVGGTTTDHVYAFGPSGATTIRSQARRTGPVGDNDGVDIFGRTTTTASITDGNWHMMTWTFNTNGSQLAVYFDGNLVETFTATAAPNNRLGDGTSPIGTLGLKADDAGAPFLEANTQLDEIWIFKGVISSNDVAQLYSANVIITQGKDVTWSGGADNNWNTTTANWLTNVGPATTFAHGDVVRIDDSSIINNINLATHLLPWSMTVSNTVADYVLSGSGKLTTTTNGLLKQGTSKLTIANSGNNSFSKITIAAGSLQVGNGGADGNLGTASIANNGSLVFNHTGNLTVSGGVSGTGMLVKSGSGTVTLVGTNNYTGSTTVNGGTLVLGTGAILSGSPQIAVTGSALTVAAVAPLTLAGSVSLTNATVTVALASAANAVTASTLAVSGANTINVASMPDVLTYPQQFTAIKYTTLNAATPTYTLGALPPTLSAPYQGYISNNVANNSIDVVITNGPSVLSWVGYSSGAPNSSWDAVTLNWKTTAGLPTTFVTGFPVSFADSASNATVSLDAIVSPGAMTVNNSALNYTFTGANNISGAGRLTKSGSGTLILDNTGSNDFTGGVVITAGTVQVGNNSGGGNLSFGTVTNSGALVFARSDDVTVANVIAGSGSINQNSAATLTLSGANLAFTGPAIVSQGTLKTGVGTALGTTNGNTTIVSGATLDVSGQNLGAEPVLVSGVGNGSGAIINSGAGQNNALQNVTMTGHTTFGGSGRWDIRLVGTSGRLSTGGNAYNITKVGANQVSLVSIVVDPALNNIDIQGGRFAVEANSTSLGNPAATLTVRSGTIFSMFNATNQLNKVILMEEGSTYHNDSGVQTIIGPINLASTGGFHTFQIDAGTTFNMQSTLTGGGLIYKTGGTGTMNITGNSPSFAGGGYFNDSIVTLSGTMNNALGIMLVSGRFNVNGTLLGNGVTNFAGSILAGSGTINGAVDAGGTVLAGSVGTAGTLTTGELNLQAGVTMTNDLGALTTPGSGINDLIQVNGNLTMNANDIYINRIATNLANGTYTLMTYTGTFNGSLGTVTLLGPAGPNVTLNHVTGSSPKRIELVVTGGVNTTPINVGTTTAGNQMTLTWPSDHIGWRLQAQTNSLATGLATTWFNVAGSQLTNQVTVPLNPANPTVFYRLIYP